MSTSLFPFRFVVASPDRESARLWHCRLIGSDTSPGEGRSGVYTVQILTAEVPSISMTAAEIQAHIADGVGVRAESVALVRS